MHMTAFQQVKCLKEDDLQHRVSSIDGTWRGIVATQGTAGRIKAEGHVRENLEDARVQ